MKARTHDNIEVWIERRLSAHYVDPQPQTLAEAEADATQEKRSVPAGEWERVDERNPRLDEIGDRLMMSSGFILEPNESSTHDLRACVSRGEKKEWKGDLKMVLSGGEGGQVASAILDTASEIRYFDLQRIEPPQVVFSQSQLENMDKVAHWFDANQTVAAEFADWFEAGQTAIERGATMRQAGEADKQVSAVREPSGAIMPPPIASTVPLFPSAQPASDIDTVIAPCDTSQAPVDDAVNILQASEEVGKADQLIGAQVGPSSKPANDTSDRFHVDAASVQAVPDVVIPHTTGAVARGEDAIAVQEAIDVAFGARPPPNDSATNLQMEDLELLFSASLNTATQKPAKPVIVPLTELMTKEHATIEPLCLLNGPETKLGVFSIRVYRGSLVATQRGDRRDRPSSPLGPAKECTDHAGGELDFDPDREVQKSEWSPLDEDDAPWLTFQYEYGPTDVWKSTSLAITDEIRQQQAKELAERLDSELKAKRAEAANARKRATELQKVKDLQARHREELERARAEAEEELARKARKGKEKHGLPAVKAKASTKAKARPKEAVAAPTQPIIGFKAPAPKRSAMPEGQVLAPLAPSSASPKSIAAGREAKAKRKEDVLVPATPSRHQGNTQFASRTSKPKCYRQNGETRPASTKTGPQHARCPASTWTTGVLVPPTSSRPRPRSPPRWEEHISEAQSSPEEISSTRDDRARKQYSTVALTERTRTQDPQSRRTTKAARTVDDRGRLQPRTLSARESRRSDGTDHRLHPGPHVRGSQPRHLADQGRLTAPDPKRDHADYVQKRLRSDGPGAYGFSAPARKRSRRDWRDDSGERGEIGLIEAQQRAFDARAEERARRKRRVEEKERRRAGGSGGGCDDRRSDVGNRDRPTADVDVPKPSGAESKERDDRRRAATNAALTRLEAERARGLKRDVIAPKNMAVPSKVAALKEVTVPREVIDMTLSD